MLHLHLVDSATDGPGFQLSYDHLFQASCFGIEPTSCFGAWYSILEYEVDVPPLVGILALSCCEICSVPH